MHVPTTLSLTSARNNRKQKLQQRFSSVNFILMILLHMLFFTEAILLCSVRERSAKPGNHLNSSHVINNSDAAIEQCDARCRCKISTALKISVRTVQYQESFQRRTNRGKTRRCHGKKTYSKLQENTKYFALLFCLFSYPRPIRYVLSLRAFSKGNRRLLHAGYQGSITVLFIYFATYIYLILVYDCWKTYLVVGRSLQARYSFSKEIPPLLQ